MMIPASALLRRPAVVILITILIALVLLSAPHFRPHARPTSAYAPAWLGALPDTSPAPEADRSIRQRLAHVRAQCKAPDAFDAEYGRTNLRLSRAYEGSLHRVQNFTNKVLRGEDVKIAYIGGSVTKGHGINEDERWGEVFAKWLNAFYRPAHRIRYTIGAVPATGSDYFSFCFPLHIPTDSDAVFVELGVNDEGLEEHALNMENLLRGLLDLPTQPAVFLVEAMAFSTGGMGGGGGRYHLPVAQYYDVPVINHRHPLANHFARFPQLIPLYFVHDWWGTPDTRHINHRGHRDLANLVASLIKDTTCELVLDPHYRVPPANPPPIVREALPDNTYSQQIQTVFQPDIDAALHGAELGWAQEERTWLKDGEPPKDDDGNEIGEAPPPEHWPGMFTRPTELGMVPRMRVLEGWNPNLDHRLPTFRPSCFTTRAEEPRFNLTPVASEGWNYWVHPDYADKPYYVGRKPGDRVTFTIDTNAGIIMIYALKSKEMNLGKVSCWVDDPFKEGHDGVVVDGWWDKDGLNIGRLASITTDIAPGHHNVTCEVLAETSDPDGGTEFRIISVVGA